MVGERLTARKIKMRARGRFAGHFRTILSERKNSDIGTFRCVNSGFDLRVGRGGKLGAFCVVHARFTELLIEGSAESDGVAAIAEPAPGTHHRRAIVGKRTDHRD